MGSRGPTYDEPRAYVKETKGATPSQEGSIDDDDDHYIMPRGKGTGYRVNNARATPSQEGSASNAKSNINSFSGYTIQASDLSDSSDDEQNNSGVDASYACC